MIYIRFLTHKLRVSPKPVFTCFVFVLVVLCPIAILAQGTPPSWVQAFGSSGSGNNISNAIKVGPDQNLYVAGRFSSTATFGSTTLTATGPFDLFLAKYSPSGALLWVAPTTQAGSDFNEPGGNGVDVDDSGNVYLTGTFYGNATFYSATPTGTKINAASGIQNAIFVAKYTSSGTLLWVQTGTSDCPYGADGWNGSWCPILGYGVGVNSAAGTVYIAGVTQDNTTFSSANGTTHVVSGTGDWDMVLAKYDTNGNFQWAELNSANPTSAGYGVAVDSNDNVYTTGWMMGDTTFFSADGKNITVTSFYYPDTYVAKYDKNGNAQWVNHIGGGVESAITIGPGGEVTVVGFLNDGTDSIVTSQPPGTSISLGSGTNPGGTDGFIATYTPAGVAIRATRHGGSSSNSITGVAYDSRDNLYVTGLVEGTSQPQLFVNEYSGKNLLWEATASAGIWANPVFLTPAVAVDAAGSVFVASGYSGAAAFGDIKLSGTGTSEAFVAELNTAFANQSADLSLRLYATPTTVHQGDLLTYTFPIWNRVPNVAYLESLKTQVPAGTTFDYILISGTEGLGTCTTPPYGGTGPITCYENSAMAPNATWTLRLTVKVTAPSGTVITETGTATEVTPDPKPSDDTATVSTMVQ